MNSYEQYGRGRGVSGQRSERDSSVGDDTRMDRLQSQIHEARASLHRYSQSSPNRQHYAPGQHSQYMQPQQNKESTSQNRDDYAREAYYEHARDHQVRAQSNNSSLRQRSHSNDRMKDRDQSRKSTEMQDTQGGYTEFFSWGNDDRGQLGHGLDHGSGTTRTLNLPKSLSFEVLISQVACGAQHSSFTTNDGHIFSFGSNVNGQLGIDDKNLNKSTAPLLVSSLLQAGQLARKISCGSGHTLVLMESGEVFSWGLNTQGQCGQSPSSASCFFGPQRIQFEASHPVSQVECGDLTSALITKAGQLYTFGDNSQGQLGLGNGVFRSQLMADKPTRVQDIFDEVLQVSCGYRHTLALTVKGQIFGFGSNRRHEMGLGEAPIAAENNFFTPLKLDQLEIHNIVQCAAGGFSAAITDLKQLIVWGTGQFGVFSTPQKVCMDGIYFKEIQISKQETSFATALDRRGAIYSWGPNFDGQLGQGDFNTRTLPTQIMRLKRKHIKQVAVGDKFSIAIGKDVSLADLMRRKAAKARKQQEQNAERANQQSSRNERDTQQRNSSYTRINAQQDNVHARISSLRQSQQQVRQSISRERANISVAEPPRRNYDNDKTGAKHSYEPTRPQRGSPRAGGYQLQANQLADEVVSEAQSQAEYSNFALTTNLNSMTLHGDNNRAANQNIVITSNESPLRQKSRGTSGEKTHFRPHQESTAPEIKEVAIGKTNIHQVSTYQVSQPQARFQDLNDRKIQNSSAHLRPPIGDAPAQPIRQRSPHHAPTAPDQSLSLIAPQPAPNPPNYSARGVLEDPQRANVERLFKLQLEEKEIVIRRQQQTIQELRVQITDEQRQLNGRIDEVTDKLRGCEVERNDLRTRLASELRNYQGSKQDLVTKLNELESEIQRLINQHESREAQMHQESRSREEERVSQVQYDARQREEQRVGQIEITHRAQLSLQEDKNRQTVKEMDNLRNSLQNEIQNMRSLMDHERDKLHGDIENVRGLLEHERNKLHKAYEDNSRLESQKIDIQDSMTNEIRNLQDQMSLEMKELQDQVERHINHIKALEIEKETLQERMQVTVQQMTNEIGDLQKQIGVKNIRIDEAFTKEEDLRRQLDHEKGMVRRRDEQNDDNINEITVLRKQIEDQHMKICGIEASKGELDQRFHDLQIQYQTQQDKLRGEQQHCQNMENQLQATRLQLERERQRCEATQADLDAQNASNVALHRELADEQHRVNSREQDIRNLEQSLQQLKESMGAEYAAKSRDFDSLKRAFDELTRAHEQVSDTLKKRNDELDSAHTMNRELQAQATALLEKASYQESVIMELEDKNKRLTDLLNAHLYDQAQSYKETVLSKLTSNRAQGTPVGQVNQLPDCVTGRFVSPFTEAHNNRSRSMTPERGALPTPANVFYNPQASQQRLNHLLRRDREQQDALSRQYEIMQRANKEKFSRSPIRGHQVRLAGEVTNTVSMTNIQGPQHTDFDSLPSQNYTTQPQMVINQSPTEMRNSVEAMQRRSSGSPLRSQKSPKPMSLKDRERDATQTASLNYSQLKANLSSSVGKRVTPNLPNFSSSQPALATSSAPPTQYSPLRSKTPPAETRIANEQETAQLQNCTVSASNISHRLMMNELKNLRGQIANVHRQKSELESRLQNYEATKMP